MNKQQLEDQLARLREVAQRRQIESGYVPLDLIKRIQNIQVKLSALKT